MACASACSPDALRRGAAAPTAVTDISDIIMALGINDMAVTGPPTLKQAAHTNRILAELLGMLALHLARGCGYP